MNMQRPLYGAVGHWLRATDRAARHRRAYYRGQTGLRILNFHATPAHHFDWFKRVASWALEQFEPATPEIADRLIEERYHPNRRDHVLFTFDDGYEDNYQAAEWLAEQGIQSIFFVVPSFIDRTIREYLQFHQDQGVTAYDFSHASNPDAIRGLRRGQILEMAEMGHRIAAHNFAHRDLGELQTPADLQYEIDRAVDAVSELLGAPCHDFSFAFGYPQNISLAAMQHARARCAHCYANVRGLNIPGDSLLALARNTLQPDQPLAFTKASASGAVDYWNRADFEKLWRQYATPQRLRAA